MAKLLKLLVLLLLTVPLWAQTWPGLDGGALPIPNPTAGTTILPSNYSTKTLPGAGSHFTEPDITGTNSTAVIWQVTNALTDMGGCALITHNYPTVNPFNEDDTLLAEVCAVNGANAIFANPAVASNATGIVVTSANMPTATSWPIVWDTQNPNAFYYGNGASVMKGTIGGTNCSSAAHWAGAPNCTVSTTTLYTSGTYTNLQFNEQDISYDGLHFWIADTAQDGGATSHILLMTLNSTNATSASLTTTVTLSAGYHKLGILPNNYLYVNGGTVTDAIYNTSGASFDTTLVSAGGHADFGYDPQNGCSQGSNCIIGVSVWYQGTSANGCTDGSYYGGVGVLDLTPGSSTINTVLRCFALHAAENYSGATGNAMHYSFRDTAGTWVLSDATSQNSSAASFIDPSHFNNCVAVSGTQTGGNAYGANCEGVNGVGGTPSWDARQEEILAWQTTASGHYYRLAHTRSRENGTTGGYWSEPRTVVSRDLQYIAFASNFDYGPSCSGTSQTPNCNTSGNATDGVVNDFVIPFLSSGGTATAPTCATNCGGTYTSSVTSTFNNSNSGTTIMCGQIGSAPATNGSGTGCSTGTSLGTGSSGTFVVNTGNCSSPCTLYVIAGVSGESDSSAVTESYTINASAGPPAAPAAWFFASLPRPTYDPQLHFSH